MLHEISVEFHEKKIEGKESALFSRGAILKGNISGSSPARKQSKMLVPSKMSLPTFASNETKRRRKNRMFVPSFRMIWRQHYYWFCMVNGPLSWLLTWLSLAGAVDVKCSPLRNCKHNTLLTCSKQTYRCANSQPFLGWCVKILFAREPLMHYFDITSCLSTGLSVPYMQVL